MLFVACGASCFGLMNLPRGLLAKLASMHDGVEWTFRPDLLVFVANEEEADQRGVAKEDTTGSRACERGRDFGHILLLDIRSQLVADIKAKAKGRG